MGDARNVFSDRAARSGLLIRIDSGATAICNHIATGHDSGRQSPGQRRGTSSCIPRIGFVAVCLPCPSYQDRCCSSFEFLDTSIHLVEEPLDTGEAVEIGVPPRPRLSRVLDVAQSDLSCFTLSRR